MTEEILRLEEVSKIYDSELGHQTALKGVSCVVPRGATIAITGRSGSGKSTLLHLAAGIDLPSSGRVFLAGRELNGLAERQRTLLRRQHVGLVFQFFYLLPHLSVQDNIALPEWIAGTEKPRYAARIEELLQRVGLERRAHSTVSELSGGEMQRIALCRALVRKPTLLLADEPTGNLDDETGRNVIDLMFEWSDREKGTVLFATHSQELAQRADFVWSLHSGMLEV